MEVSGPRWAEFVQREVLAGRGMESTGISISNHSTRTLAKEISEAGETLSRSGGREGQDEVTI